MTVTTYKWVLDGIEGLTADATTAVYEIENTQKVIEKTVHGSVSIYKQDQNDDPLTGAEFTLYKASTCEDTDKIKTYNGAEFEIKTDDSDLAGYLPIPDGETVTLYLKETKAPDGYVLSDTVYPITITTAISDPMYDAADDAFITTTTYSIDVDGEDHANITNKQTSVKVQKIDIDTGEELTGAHIQILDEEGNVVAEWDSVSGLPHVETGLKTGVEYTLRETVAPLGYTITSDTQFTISETGTITYSGTVATDEDGNEVLLVEDKVFTTSAAVKKIWNDDGNRDGLQPLTLEVELLADGEKTGKTVVLTAANNWIEQISNIRKYNADGTEIVYTWSEPVITGYTLTGMTKTGNLTSITNTHTPETLPISVRKVWVDDGTHPKEVKVQLFADGLAVGEAITLSAANEWKYSWDDLCRNVTENGVTREIRYTVSELEIPEGYTAKITGGVSTGFVITNTYSPGKLIIEKEFDIELLEETPEDDELKTEIEVVKIWDDNDNKDGNRPESITVHLFAGGEEVKTAKLTAQNGWRKKWGDLPKFVDGHPIHYSVTEDPVEMYVPEIHGFTITNHYRPETTSVIVQKIWHDEGFENMRPESIIVKLNNGMCVILNEANGWTGVINGLPTYVNGEPAVYTWCEPEVMGYTQESMVTEGNVTVITNQIWKREEEPKIGKKPKVPGDDLTLIDEYDTPLGVEVIINHVGDCFD